MPHNNIMGRGERPTRAANQGEGLRPRSRGRANNRTPLGQAVDQESRQRQQQEGWTVDYGLYRPVETSISNRLIANKRAEDEQAVSNALKRAARLDTNQNTPPSLNAPVETPRLNYLVRDQENKEKEQDIQNAMTRDGVGNKLNDSGNRLCPRCAKGELNINENICDDCVATACCECGSENRTDGPGNYCDSCRSKIGKHHQSRTPEDIERAKRLIEEIQAAGPDTVIEDSGAGLGVFQTGFSLAGAAGVPLASVGAGQMVRSKYNDRELINYAAEEVKLDPEGAVDRILMKEREIQERDLQGKVVEKVKEALSLDENQDRGVLGEIAKIKEDLPARAAQLKADGVNVEGLNQMIASGESLWEKSYDVEGQLFSNTLDKILANEKLSEDELNYANGFAVFS